MNFVLALLFLVAWVAPARSAEPDAKPGAAKAEAAPLDATASDSTRWREARPPNGYFQILIPGPFDAFADPAETDNGVKGEVNGVRANLPGAFGGKTQYAASCVVAPGDTRTQKERIQAGMDHWERLTVLHWRKPIELQGVPGVEFQLADDLKVLRLRVYAPEDRTCTLLMHWRPFSKPTDAHIAKFFDSFQILKP